MEFYIYNRIESNLYGPRPSITSVGLAGVYQKEGKFREALQAYQFVLQSNPECPASVRVGIGNCLARLGRTANVGPLPCFTLPGLPLAVLDIYIYIYIYTIYINYQGVEYFPCMITSLLLSYSLVLMKHRRNLLLSERMNLTLAMHQHSWVSPCWSSATRRCVDSSSLLLVLFSSIVTVNASCSCCFYYYKSDEYCLWPSSCRWNPCVRGSII